ncbi:uncharacterized protein LOC126906048 [Daktulosphaira vitifoliae]|uniref:uncharacterized protein LOC126906048 n=1 Tax=Daktulosphaira vitifoliae TaxID=58002 RepID=UPI0021A9BB3D|nr:uncharacterized protein LOC126906048 [Daktulosphaira vitifoliae]
MMNRLCTALMLSVLIVANSHQQTNADDTYIPLSNSSWFLSSLAECNGKFSFFRCVVLKSTDRVARLLDNIEDLEITKGVFLSKSKAHSRSFENEKNITVMEKILSFINNRKLKIDLRAPPDSKAEVEGRRRHSYRRVFPIIVSTYMIMSAILIPLGFMFMSTLGGKALIVSKMALMISLMSNLKKMFSNDYYVPPSSAPAYPWKRTLLSHRNTDGPIQFYSYTT